jgi:hypothetical protein
MPKPNPLSQGLSQQVSAVRPVAAPAPDERRARKSQPPSRSGRVLIGGHFAPEVQTALKILAAEERTTMQALLAEAINSVFAKRHKPEIADISTN